ncbi:MAG: sugar phosphate isomerase/epimerase [Lentisphaerae bacterium]|nr:sugar phosphate isomerase/epimerase [Lentisphaerota bacterium]
MNAALSTNWNSQRHSTGEALVDEAVSLGFDAVEIGYLFQPALEAGLRRRLAAGAIRVCSVHAFSPVPLSVPGGHPELFLPAAADEDERRLAVFHLRNTLAFAASLGARAVVVHAGRVPVGSHWARVAQAHEQERTGTWRYRWHRRRLLALRARRAACHLAALRRSLDELLPLFADAGVVLAMENLPSWDALPQADEALALIEAYATPWLRYWHDIGHGQILENAGLTDHLAVARRMLGVTAGVHLHDVQGPMRDHQAPGSGGIDFSGFGFLARPDILHVFEPSPSVPPSDLANGLRHIRRCWGGQQLQTNVKEQA